MTQTAPLSNAGRPAAVQPSAILAVIPALNEARHIETCIRSLMAGSQALRQVPMLVADGGSSDDTVAIVERLRTEFPNLSVLHNPKRLQAAALNLAAAGAPVAATILVRCDAHSIYPENFILDVAQSLVDTGAASLVIPMDAVGETCFEKANAWIVDTPLGSGGAAHRGGKASGWVDHGHHAGFDLSWYRRIGGYDESFSHNEDAEYDVRLGKAGGRVYLDAGIRIQYIPRGNVRRLWKQYEGYGRGRAKNVRKHGSRLKLRQTVPIFALLGSALGLVASLVYWPAIILPLGYVAILALASGLVALKHKSLCGLYAGLAAGTMHMSWAFGYLREATRPKG
ncbi:MAG: glycosyltransferase family 2 protein [Hyphomonas sp.]|uniref:glycosyltransferase family 2 protein n=1 Tax=Hyphomonas sp. TaxID=87 RepID=UPI0025BAC037|nr:glycosyltransferase family 2 protein [Hyphomonas sp.]MBA4339769.1 glycosyltransferase family 2 protein [Hyphomonas sp.]